MRRPLIDSGRANAQLLLFFNLQHNLRPSTTKPTTPASRRQQPGDLSLFGWGCCTVDYCSLSILVKGRLLSKMLSVVLRAAKTVLPDWPDWYVSFLAGGGGLLLHPLDPFSFFSSCRDACKRQVQHCWRSDMVYLMLPAIIAQPFFFYLYRFSI